MNAKRAPQEYRRTTGQPIEVPTLDELAADPDRASALPVRAAEALQGKCLMALNALWGRCLAARADRADPEMAADTLLDVTEAAKRLATTRDWLYRHARQLPFVVRNGRQLRFSAAGIARYIREREGA
jgi:predicted DNA-binding transcriptional regulator AlpA